MPISAPEGNPGCLPPPASSPRRQRPAELSLAPSPPHAFPREALGYQAERMGTSEPTPFLGKAPRDGAGRDNRGRVLNCKSGP